MTHIKEITEDSKKSISEIHEKEKVYVHTCASAMSHYVAQADSNKFLLLQPPECWLTAVYCHAQRDNGISGSI